MAACSGVARGFPRALDAYAFSQALKSGAPGFLLAALSPLHCVAVKVGLLSSPVAATALINAAFKSKRIGYAASLFDEMPQSSRDVVAWTSMVAGNAQMGRYGDSLKIFGRMVCSGVTPNAFSLSAALAASAGAGSLCCGRQVHARVAVGGERSEVVWNAVVDMYAKCRIMGDARRVFAAMTNRSIVAWNSMMSGYVCADSAEEALVLFAEMVSSGVRPDCFSLAACVDASSAAASLKGGGQAHVWVVKAGFESDLVVQNSLLGMYAKCGCIHSAELVFRLSPVRDAVLWTTLMSAYSKCGRPRDAIAMFEEMAEAGIRRDEVALLAVLTACSHGGLVSEGWMYFRSAFSGRNNSIKAMPEHYRCMVDLLCRCGHLEEAVELMNAMPFDPGVASWSALLNSARLHGNAELCRLAVSSLRRLDPGNDSSWVSLAGILLTAEEREELRLPKIKKEPGCSWVEVRGGVHVFLATDRPQPELEDALWSLETLEKDSFAVHSEAWVN